MRPAQKQTAKPSYLFETMPLHLRLIGILVLYPLYGFFLSRIVAYTIGIPVYYRFSWPSEEAFTIFYNILFQGVLIICLILLLHNVLLQSFHDLKKHSAGNFFGWVILSYFFFYAVSLVFSLVELLLTGDTAGNSRNQTAIGDMMRVSPAAIAFLAVLLAPITEELLFRGIIFRTFRPLGSVPAILVSALLFGFQHVSDYVLAGDFSEIPYMIAYTGMGLALALIYEKRRNLLIVIAIHMVQNTVSMVLMLIL